MVLVLVIGDIHVPHRAADIPPEFKKLLLPNKMKHIFITGNLCTKDKYDYFRGLCSDVHVVKGDFDEQIGSLTLPEEKVIEIDGIKIGLIHGHQIVPWGDKESLAAVQRRLDVDILVSGHTHQLDISKYDEKIFINPGTLTGAYSGLSDETVPSFIMMDIQDSSVIVFVYELKEGKVVVTRNDFKLEKKESS